MAFDFSKGHASAGGPDVQPRKPHEPTAEEKAQHTANVAANLDRYQRGVTEGVAAMIVAEAQGDVVGWERAHRRATLAMQELRDAAQPAFAMRMDAADAEVQQRLTSAVEVVGQMAQQLASAPAAPEKKAPELSCADSLLAALPPDRPVSGAHAVFERARRAVETVFRAEMTFKDLEAFSRILSEFRSHEIARRFARFGDEKQAALRAVLQESKVRARARARGEALARAAAQVQAPAGFTPPTIDKPAEYEEQRATIDIGGGELDVAEREPPAAAAALPDAEAAVARANGTAMDMPAAYEESRATIDIDGGLTEAEREPAAAAAALPDAEGAVARANGTAMDMPAAYEESRATLEVAEVDADAEADVAEGDPAARPRRQATRSPRSSGREGAAAGAAASAPRASAADGLVPPQVLTCEAPVLAALATAAASTDAAGLQRRKRAVVGALAAVPDGERAALALRLRTPGDPLAALLGQLDPGTHAAAWAALEAGVVAAPMPADSVEWSAFLAAVTTERVFTNPPELTIDGAWRSQLDVAIGMEAGYGPPHPGPGAEVHVQVLDRAGEVLSRQVVAWPAAAFSFATVRVTLASAGRHELILDIVEGGQVRKRINRPLVVRSEGSGEVAADLSDAERRRGAAEMSDADVGDQAQALREQLAAKETPGAQLGADGEYQQLRAALAELEWQAHEREQQEAAATGDPQAAHANAIDTAKPAFDHRQGRAVLGVDPADRPAMRRLLEDLIARKGFDGARIHIGVHRQLDANGRAAHGTPLMGDPEARWNALLDELEALRAEHAATVAEFTADAQSVALTLLDQSEAQIQSEMERYGIVQTGPHRSKRDDGRGAYRSQGAEPNAELTGLAEEAARLAEMKRTMDRYVREVEGRADDGIGLVDPGTPEKIEGLALKYTIALQRAVERYPSLLLFLHGGKQAHMPRLDDVKPGEFSGDGGALAPWMGWELGEKLADIATARAKLADPRAALTLPKVVALTKRQRHIAPGTIVDGLVNEGAAQASEMTWEEKLLILFQISLTIGLIAASGGAAAPAAAGAGGAAAGSVASRTAVAAAQIAEVAADLYTVMEQLDASATLRAFHNTHIDDAQALLDDLPSPFLDLVGVILAPAGVGGAVRSARTVGLAKDAAAAGKQLQAAIVEAGGDLAAARVVERIGPMRRIAEQHLGAGADDFMQRVLDAMAGAVKTGRRGLGRAANALGLEALARRLGVPRVVQVADPDIGVRILVRHEAGRIVPLEIQVREGVDEALVLEHLDTVDAIERLNRKADQLRNTIDEAAHTAGEAEAAIEIQKHEQMIRARGQALADALNRGEPNAVGRIEDEILSYEGDLVHWRDKLARGDVAERGFVEAMDPTATNLEALRKHYPELPDGYRYRRWRQVHPEDPEYQIVRTSDAEPGATGKRLVRRPEGWDVVDTDTIGKAPHVYDDAAQSSRAVLDDLFERSPSLAQYERMMVQLEELRGLGQGHYRERMRAIIDSERSASQRAGGELAGAVDEDTLRSAIKDELRPDVLAYLDDLDAAGSYQMLRKLTDDLNNSDMGNIAEEWYARRYAASGEPHARASKEALANGRPPIEIERNRYIDNMGEDGTATEIKSITGKLSERELEQLEDYRRMAEGGAEVGQKGRRVKKIRYTFTRSEGLKANLDRVEDMLEAQAMAPEAWFSCEVFLSDGTRVSIDSLDDLNTVRAAL